MNFRLSSSQLLLIVSCALLGVFVFTEHAHAGIIPKPANNLGLVGYWSLNEGNGTVAGDFSGNGNDGTLKNMDPSTDWVDGRYGKALDFDGSGDEYVDTQYGEGTTGNQTVAAWVKTRSSGSTQHILNPYNGNKYNLRIQLESDNSARAVRYDGSVQGDAVDPDTLKTGKWYFVVGVYNSNTEKLSLYVNGTEVATDNNNVSITTQHDYYMGREPNGGGPFDGQIDNVRIYNRALSDAEVRDLYQRGLATVKQPDRTGLVGYWSLDEGNGSEAGDFSGNGNDGTLKNMDPSTDWVDGRYGQGLDFDGSDDYIKTESFDPYNTAVTISAWINMGQSSTSGNDWLFNHYADGSNRFGVFLGSSDNLKAYGKESGTVVSAEMSGNPLDQGTWHLVTITWTDSEMKLFVDGDKKASDSTTVDVSSIGSGNLYINGFDGSSQYLVDAEIDNVRVYNRALSANEVKALYQSTQHTVNASRNDQLTDGLQGMWSFDGPDLTAATATDASGNDNDGTLHNGPQPAIGTIGQALEFDGSDDYVRVADDASLDGMNKLTISLWAKLDALPSKVNTDQTLINKDDSSFSSRTYRIYLESDATPVDAPRFAIGDGDGNYAILAKGDTSFSKDVWYHIVGMFDGSTAHLYLNGAKEGSDTNTQSIADTNTTVRIGTAHSSGFDTDGVIDNVRIYNRALSPQEIQRLYNLGR